MLSLATGRVADRWGAELARASTLRISAHATEIAAQTEAALRVLATTPGVAAARAITPEEIARAFGALVGDGLAG